ncbi:ribosomal protein L5 [Dacryopinax primogenitus]|uniref:Ribosomal protein L5 n=1 Tax=Dacryopinax primogenitus (strain DJM 731) TaxID=1858805 RepID=M5GEJ6_DACPD|nr:ribosomal protein L5 [Dacryopinax primogenitus]EJU03318.1 ribosomal protein L5 [Dacryopinax primogenitus]
MEARYRHIESDLLYLLYDPHMPADLPDPIVHIPLPNPDNPYEANRHLVRPKGGHLLRPNAKPVSPFTLPKLQKIVFHSYVKEAAHNKSALVPAIAAARAISGSTREGGNIPGLSGVQLVYSRRSLPTWRLREGVAIGVKVEMRGEQMWAFLNSLIEFVIPRMRDFKGFALPTSSSSPNTPNNISGTVSVGFPPTAMGLFPQIEINFDNYPRMYGFHVQFVTDQRGKGAQDRARQLMSAFRIPFVRR